MMSTLPYRAGGADRSDVVDVERSNFFAGVAPDGSELLELLEAVFLPKKEERPVACSAAAGAGDRAALKT